MQHLFVMDPIAKLDPKMDSSLRMAFGLKKLGHRSFATTPWELYWDKDEGMAAANCFAIDFHDTPDSAFFSAEQTVHQLGAFKTIHMRKDPPFDMNYITATWLLETAPKGTHVLNSPRGLRTINEKVVILRYPEAIDPAIISASPEQLLDFLVSKCNGDGIIKPLNLYSGKGIFRVNLAEQSKAAVLELFKNETEGVSQRILQPFNKAIYDGEVRVFAIHGEPLAWCIKKPAKGEFMANSSFGSTRHAYTPTKEEDAIVRRISEELRSDGIEIVGYDLIGGKISEINVTSPRLLTAPDDKTDYYGKMAEWLIGLS